MPKLTTPLTDVHLRNAKPKDKPYKLADGDSLHLLITPNGAKHWQMRYRDISGKEQTLTIGPYPEVSWGKPERSGSMHAGS